VLFRAPQELDGLIRSVYGYVAYRIGDGPDAEDVTGTTFERALRYRGSFDARKGPAVAWLIGIARRCIDDFHAARGMESYEVFDGAAPGDLEADALRRLAVQDAIRRLDPRDRELIALRYGADLRAKQIAAALEQRTNTVEVALHRALGRLRTILEDAGDEN
jgi:RNA polymerase sigma-70 factor (ECF subfamily)